MHKQVLLLNKSVKFYKMDFIFLQQYKNNGLIDETYKIISKETTYSTKELTSKVISEGFICMKNFLFSFLKV
jgi:hypothetical protein